MNNPESLRNQLIDAMVLYEKKFQGIPKLNIKGSCEALFDGAIWPVLEAAMKNGELLVSRNTAPRVPIHKAVMDWLEGVQVILRLVKTDGATISRGKLLKLVLSLGEMGEQVLQDAKSVTPNFTPTKH